MEINVGFFPHFLIYVKEEIYFVLYKNEIYYHIVYWKIEESGEIMISQLRTIYYRNVHKRFSNYRNDFEKATRENFLWYIQIDSSQLGRYLFGLLSLLEMKELRRGLWQL